MRTAIQLLCLAAGISFVGSSAIAADLYTAEEGYKMPEAAKAHGIVGHLGAEGGWNHVTEVDDSPDRGSVYYYGFEGSLAIHLGSFLVGGDANYRYDNFQATDDFDDDEDPESQWDFTGHVLYKHSPTSRFGGFYQYADTRPQDGDMEDAYNLWVAGVEVQHFLADNVLVYGQGGVGDKIREGQDEDEGFKSGWVFRGGLTYFHSDSTALNADFEFAGSDNYIDSNDPGRHFGASLSGETWFGDRHPLSLTYGGRYTHINSTDEGDSVDEVEVFLGLRYAFGADSPRDFWANGLAIGGPRLPVRSSAWVEYLD